MKTADIPITLDTLYVRIINEDMLITCFDNKGTVHFEFIRWGQTVN